ncbi:MAG: hypothetical protein EU547_00230 [Promethearchaeota archaeon]|nr:MAG: hypothetical protein EU547_00230 [Candidatus Lokiarchaeota archaeon]
MARKKWKVALSISKQDGENAQEIELFDAARYFDGYLTIKRSYFNGLLQTIKTSKNYNTANNIEKIISPKDKDWTLNPWILLLIKDKEKGKRFWFLIKREKDLSALLVAIGPKEFADYNHNNSEAKKEIMRILGYIVAYLTKFDCLIALPKFLEN